MMKPIGNQGSLRSIKSTSKKSLVSKKGSKNRGTSLTTYYEELDKVEPRIDNKPPKFEIDMYYKPRMIEADARAIMDIDRKNLELLKKLNTIHRTGGYVDCWNSELKYKPPLADKKDDVDRIESENRELINRIEKASGLYRTADLMREWRESRAATKKSSKNPLSRKSRSALKITKKQLSPSLNEIPSIRNTEDFARPRCYFEIEIEEQHRRLGKIIFELFSDVAPKTCDNFLSFCSGFNGLSYKGTPFHRIMPGYWCQGGDVTKFNGSGGTSIYGDTFEDENFEMRHSEPGILSTCGYGENMNNSKFNLTFKKLETVDGKRVVFGKVIGGFPTLRELERFGTNHGRPTMRIIVSKCGVL